MNYFRVDAAEQLEQEYVKLTLQTIYGSTGVIEVVVYGSATDYPPGETVDMTIVVRKFIEEERPRRTLEQGY